MERISLLGAGLLFLAGASVLGAAGAVTGRKMAAADRIAARCLPAAFLLSLLSTRLWGGQLCALFQVTQVVYVGGMAVLTAAVAVWAAFRPGKAAYAAGAGLVQIYTEESNRVILQQLLPEAVISCYEEYEEEMLSALLKWADVVCIGCGLGTDHTAERLLEYTMKNVTVPCIVDADGLNLLGRKPELTEGIRTPVILTPHMKEMSRLTGYPVSEIKEHRMEILKEFTGRYPAVCVLKDSRTLVAKKGRHTFLNLAGNSAMAKAGAGDVLAGVITALAAQGKDAFESAALGVYLHACGGDEAQRQKGSYSVLARDLIRGIEKCMSANRKEA